MTKPRQNPSHLGTTEQEERFKRIKEESESDDPILKIISKGEWRMKTSDPGLLGFQ